MCRGTAVAVAAGERGREIIYLGKRGMNWRAWWGWTVDCSGPRVATVLVTGRHTDTWIYGVDAPRMRDGGWGLAGGYQLYATKRPQGNISK